MQVLQVPLVHVKQLFGQQQPEISVYDAVQVKQLAADEHDVHPKEQLLHIPADR